MHFCTLSFQNRSALTDLAAASSFRGEEVFLFRCFYAVPYSAITKRRGGEWVIARRRGHNDLSGCISQGHWFEPNMVRFSFNVRFPTCDCTLAWNTGALQHCNYLQRVSSAKRMAANRGRGGWTLSQLVSSVSSPPPALSKKHQSRTDGYSPCICSWWARSLLDTTEECHDTKQEAFQSVLWHESERFQVWHRRGVKFLISTQIASFLIKAASAAFSKTAFDRNLLADSIW